MPTPKPIKNANQNSMQYSNCENQIGILNLEKGYPFLF